MKHERTWTFAWLGGSALLLIVLGVWGVGLGGAERTVAALEGRWQSRLDEAEELFAEGRFKDAAAKLALIDRDHPAIFVKHKLDRQRERVLELLARSQMELGKQGRAADTAERLARFDPNNWANHYLCAEVAERFGDGGAADKAYARVLELHPSHLPSAQGRITLAFEGGNYAAVPPLFEAYLDAWRVAVLAVTADGRSTEVEVLVDGRPHWVSARLEGAHDGSGWLTLDPAGYSTLLSALELCPDVGGGTEPTLFGAFPAAVAEPMRMPFPKSPQVDRIKLQITVFKPLPTELWAMVEKSYENTLDAAGLARVRERTRIGAPDAPLQLVD